MFSLGGLVGTTCASRTLLRLVRGDTWWRDTTSSETKDAIYGIEPNNVYSCLVEGRLVVLDKIGGHGTGVVPHPCDDTRHETQSYVRVAKVDIST